MAQVRPNRGQGSRPKPRDKLRLPLGSVIRSKTTGPGWCSGSRRTPARRINRWSHPRALSADSIEPRPSREHHGPLVRSAGAAENGGRGERRLEGSPPSVTQDLAGAAGVGAREIGVNISGRERAPRYKWEIFPPLTLLASIRLLLEQRVLLSRHLPNSPSSADGSLVSVPTSSTRGWEILIRRLR